MRGAHGWVLAAVTAATMLGGCATYPGYDSPYGYDPNYPLGDLGSVYGGYPGYEYDYAYPYWYGYPYAYGGGYPYWPAYWPAYTGGVFFGSFWYGCCHTSYYHRYGWYGHGYRGYYGHGWYGYRGGYYGYRGSPGYPGYRGYPGYQGAGGMPGWGAVVGADGAVVAAEADIADTHHQHFSRSRCYEQTGFHQISHTCFKKGTRVA